MANGVGEFWAVGVVGLTMTLVCLWPMYKGWQRRRRYQLVRDTPTETPETAGHGDTVLLTGVARGTGDVTAPVSGDEALLATWAIQEWQDESSQLKYWTPEARGLRTDGFRIESDGSAVEFPARTDEATTDDLTSLVGYDVVTGLATDDALVEVAEFDTVEEVPQADDPPERLRDLERRVGLDEPDAGTTLIDLGRTHGTRRYREAVLDDGDGVTIRGTVTAPERPGASPTLSIPEEGPAIVSDLDADALASRYRWAYWKQFYGSIAVVLTLMLFAAVAIA